MPASASQGSSGRYRPASSHLQRRTARPRPATSDRAATPDTPAPTQSRSYSTGGRGELVLDVQDLKTYFFTYDGVVRALEGINLQVRGGETTAIVGETGCGKSVTAFSIARLIAEPGRVISGKIMFQGANLLFGLEREAKYRRLKGSNRVKVIRSFRRIKAGNDRMAAVRGRGIGMVFQEPGQAMNPVFSIADQLGEAILLHRGLETVEGLLKASAAVRAQGGVIHQEYVPESPEGHPVEISAGPAGDIDRLLHAAATGTREELRARSAEVAARVGLPSIGTELFYLLRDAGPRSFERRSRVYRVLQRAHLSGFQQGYLRHQRRLMILEQAMKDLYFKEMKIGKSQLGARSQISLRIRFERLKHFYYGLWGVHRAVHKPIRDELMWRVVALLEGLQIANPVQVARGFPHELSGGMLQRAMIAMALSCEPALLLADEPTTALDVTIQAQILELMRQLKAKVGTAIVLITHDLGVVAEVCDRVNVMYAGLIIESGPVHELFRRPLHPYTQGLLASIPRFDQPDKELASIPGSVPNLITPPPGCRFHPRCPYAMPICKEVRPLPQMEGEDHMVACHLYGETGAPTTPGVTAPAPGPVPFTPARARPA